MTSEVDGGARLDRTVIDSLADVICGDDTSAYYRTGAQIARLSPPPGGTGVVTLMAVGANGSSNSSWIGALIQQPYRGCCCV